MPCALESQRYLLQCTFAEELRAARSDYRQTREVYLRVIWEFLQARRRDSRTPQGLLASSPAYLPHSPAPRCTLTKGHNAVQKRTVSKTETNQRIQSRVVSPLVKIAPSLHSSYELRSRAVQDILKDPRADEDQDALKELEQSVTIIIVKRALERSLQRLCLHFLRCNMIRNKRLRQIAGEHFVFRRKQKVLDAWKCYTVGVRQRGQELVGGIIRFWQDYSRRRRAFRQCLHRFTAGLHIRAVAWRSVALLRLSSVLERWQRRTREKRQRRLQWETASLLQRDRQATRNYERRGQAPLPGVTLRFCFIAWRKKTEARLHMQLANWTYRLELLRLTWHRWGMMMKESQRRNDNCLIRMPRGDADSLCSRRLVTDVGYTSVDSVSPFIRVLQRGKMRAKEGARRHELLVTAFRSWQRQYVARQGDKFYLQHTRAGVVRRWLSALFQRRIKRDAACKCFQEWRRGARSTRLVRNATALYQKKFLEVVFSRWWSLFKQSREQKTEKLRNCLVRWKCAWYQKGKAYCAKRDCTTLSAAWRRWREHLEQRRRYLTYFVLANSIRETVMLSFCFQHWVKRAKDVRRGLLKFRIFGDYLNQRRLKQCFDTWRQRTTSICR